MDSSNEDDKKEKDINNEEEEEEEEGESSESEVELNTITIKKQTQCTISLDKKVYQKLLNLLQDTIATNIKLRNKLNIIHFNRESQTEEEMFRDSSSSKKKENIISINADKIKEFEATIKRLTEENDKLKKENESFQIKIKQIEENAKKQSETLTNELNQIKEENQKHISEIKKLKISLESKLKKNNTFDTISSHPKLIASITQFLKSEDKISLARTTRFLWLEIFYRTKS